MTPDAMPLDGFLDLLKQDPDLQQKVKVVSTATEVAAIANEAGFAIRGADVIQYFATSLLNCDDTLAEKRFDSLGWDMGELLWALKTWH